MIANVNIPIKRWKATDERIYRKAARDTKCSIEVREEAFDAAGNRMSGYINVIVTPSRTKCCSEFWERSRVIAGLTCSDPRAGAKEVKRG